MLKLLLTSYSDSWSDLEKVSKCPRAAFTRKTTLLVTHIKAVTNEWNFFLMNVPILGTSELGIKVFTL